MPPEVTLPPEGRAVVEAWLKRQQQKASNEDLIARIESELFEQQVDFVNDPSREKGALCTRRAGKTSMWARYARKVTLKHERVIVRIWGITRLRAKQMLWDELKLLDARHKIECNYNETELTARLPNGSEIRLLGADKDKEAQKKRGDKTILEIVLEAQLYGPFLKSLVEDIAMPCLFDLKGTMCLEGTPGPVCAGYWFDVSGNEDFASKWLSRGGKEGSGAGWSMHRWSLLDNPKMPQWEGKANWREIARAEVAALKLRRRWTEQSPTYLREYLGRWVNDLGALYYRFDPNRNTFTLDEVKPWGPGWEHTLGWDLGFKDDMAIVVWAFHPSRAELYEAFSWKKPGALSAEVVGVIRDLETKGVDGTAFNVVRKFADTGGGGKMYVEDITSRYGMQFQAAKKTEKYEHVRLFNDDLQGGFIRLQRDSVYAQELATLPRDLDWPPPEKPEAAPREDPRFPNHCSDAGLYGYRGSWHYLHEETPAKSAPGTPTWYAEECARMEQAVLDRATQREDDNFGYFGTDDE